MIEPKDNIIRLSLNIIKIFLERNNFNCFIYDTLQFIDMDIDKIGFFSHFSADYNFKDIVYSKIYGKDENGNIILFNVFANGTEIEVEGTIVGSLTYIFDKNINLFIND